MTELSAFMGFLGGAIAGAFACWMALGTTNPYGRWLERECWVRPHGRAVWKRHVIVAVSWHGGVCVKDAERLDEDGYWIKKQNVRWRVRWDEPRD